MDAQQLGIVGAIVGIGLARWLVRRREDRAAAAELARHAANRAAWTPAVNDQVAAFLRGDTDRPPGAQ